PRLECEVVPGRVLVDDKPRVIGSTRVDRGAARFVLVVALHELCVEAVAAQMLDHRVAGLVATDARADSALKSELCRLKRHVHRRAARLTSVGKAIPKGFAKTDDCAWILH